MPITTPKELIVTMLSDLRHGTERSATLYDELAKIAQDAEIKEALDAREFVSAQILSKLDECFRLIGEKPVQHNGRLHEILIEDFRTELSEIQSPVARRIFILAKAIRLMHLWVGEYAALIAVVGATGHPAAFLLLESCLADKLAFIERTKRLIREELREMDAVTKSIPQLHASKVRG